MKENTLIFIIILLFIFFNIIFLTYYNDVWWDSSVYIGMGKYIFSGGNAGLWESSRPLVLPTILGAGWSLGLDAVYFGRIVSIIFAILVVYMLYLIGANLFSKKIALLAAFFTAFSFNFLSSSVM